MNAPDRLGKPALIDPFSADTHEVFNVGRELVDFNAYEQDSALRQAVEREGAGWAHQALVAFGALTEQQVEDQVAGVGNHAGPEITSMRNVSQSM